LKKINNLPPAGISIAVYSACKRLSLALLGTTLLFIFFIFSAFPGSNHDLPAENSTAILWKMPEDISSRDLLKGNGGGRDEPQGPFVFIEENRKGTNPKFDVYDRNGIKWSVKLGVEARPEVAASRLLWAVGYFTAEYYFLPKMQIQNMPKLKRGNQWIKPDGFVYGARLKRSPGGTEKAGNWKWKRNPFTGTREFNGLRVMMALINNWDLKDQNTGIFSKKEAGKDIEIYFVSDLGSSFGTSNWIRPLKKAKGNLPSYGKSEFIQEVDSNRVDFDIAGRPAFINAVNFPLYFQYVRMGWIGKQIPCEDARWIGQLLSRLSVDQIRDAFRSAGYSNQQVEGFTQNVIARIAELKEL
jgi:hypothetical protein